jgi:DNA-binding PadR family transcriptional regulator
MVKRRKVNNLLALALLSELAERPMHPYEMASVLRARGKDHSLKIRWGSLYTVVQNLDKYGFIQATGTTRQGRRPERTVYHLTDAGREELGDWMRDLVGTPQREYPKFEAALSELSVLPPDEAMELLEQRAGALDSEITAEREALQQWSQEVPRLFLIEAEYHVAILEAEATWIRSMLKELTDGSLPGLREWRSYHETGQMPPEFATPAKEATPQD